MASGKGKNKHPHFLPIATRYLSLSSCHSALITGLPERRAAVPGAYPNVLQRSRFFASSSIINLMASGEMLDSPRSMVILSSLPVKANGTW